MAEQKREDALWPVLSRQALHTGSGFLCSDYASLAGQALHLVLIQLWLPGW